MSSYTMDHKYGNMVGVRLKRENPGSSNIAIPFALVEYEIM